MTTKIYTAQLNTANKQVINNCMFMQKALISITSFSSSGELRLAHTSVIASICEVIAQVISSSSTIKMVDLSDCMLLAKGLSSIFKALCEGSTVLSLYLKGNNISGPLVEQLGEMLQRNSTLRIMHVEWNNLGSQVDCFAKFCDGLARNHYIEELDLRYNQISTMCADSLAAALKTNRSLKNLDLSWNSLGNFRVTYFGFIESIK